MMATGRWPSADCCKALLAVLLLSLLAGCAGFARGVTEAVLGKEKEKKDTRQCYIRGRPFDGIEMYLQQQELEAAAGAADRRYLKVLMVHGIGSHHPGHATRLAENLARALALPKVQEKEFRLFNPNFSEPTLGILRVSRYLNADGSRVTAFYELTWDPIVEAEKQTIAFDNSGEYAFRRTSINNALKLFVNDTVPDVLMYDGRFRDLRACCPGSDQANYPNHVVRGRTKQTIRIIDQMIQNTP